MRFRRAAFVAALVVTGVAASPSHAQSPLTFTSADQRHTVSVGLLAQPQADWEHVGTGQDTGSLCFRRLRVMAGGKVFGKLRFFVESDSPFLGVVSDARQIDSELYLQDLIVTWEARDEFQLEGGLLMVPVSYNSTQSATSLLGASYGPYSFLASTPTTSKVGRDYGIQARGYLARKHLEYRVGVFEGIREVDPSAPPRVAARVVWYPFDSQTGFFYTGTTLGKKHILAVGASVDHQADYDSRSVDVFWDRPLTNGHAFTAQFDYIRYDGARTLPTLPRQDAWLAEVGYYWPRERLGAYAQVARRDRAAVASPDATSYQAGAVYWLRGHKLNLKGGIVRVLTDRAPGRTQLVFQTQVLAF